MWTTFDLEYIGSTTPARIPKTCSRGSQINHLSFSDNESAISRLLIIFKKLSFCITTPFGSDVLPEE